MQGAAWQSRLQRMMRSNPSDWTLEILDPLSLTELQALAMLMGIPYTGTKIIVRDRLLDAADLRTILSDAEAPPDLVARFKLKELQAMCRRAKIYIAKNKYGAAAGLLNWRNGCRQRGREFLAEWRKAKPMQLTLPFRLEPDDA